LHYKDTHCGSDAVVASTGSSVSTIVKRFQGETASYAALQPTGTSMVQSSGTFLMLFEPQLGGVVARQLIRVRFVQ